LNATWRNGDWQPQRSGPLTYRSSHCPVTDFSNSSESSSRKPMPKIRRRSPPRALMAHLLVPHQPTPNSGRSTGLVFQWVLTGTCRPGRRMVQALPRPDRLRRGGVGERVGPVG
jgi:hypothetical protein